MVRNKNKKTGIYIYYFDKVCPGRVIFDSQFLSNKSKLADTPSRRSVLQIA